MYGHQTEDAGLADGALLVGVAPHQPRDQVGQLGTEVVGGREGRDLRGGWGDEKREGGGGGGTGSPVSVQRST